MTEAHAARCAEIAKHTLDKVVQQGWDAETTRAGVARVHALLEKAAAVMGELTDADLVRLRGPAGIVAQGRVVQITLEPEA